LKQEGRSVPRLRVAVLSGVDDVVLSAVTLAGRSRWRAGAHGADGSSTGPGGWLQQQQGPFRSRHVGPRVAAGRASKGEQDAGGW
jgi:hypothetical protein